MKQYAIILNYVEGYGENPKIEIVKLKKEGKFPNIIYKIGDTEIPLSKVGFPHRLYVRIKTKAEGKETEEIIPLEKVEVVGKDLKLYVDRASIDSFLRRYVEKMLRRLDVQPDIIAKITKAILIGMIVIGIIFGIGIYAALSTLKINVQPKLQLTPELLEHLQQKNKNITTVTNNTIPW